METSITLPRAIVGLELADAVITAVEFLGGYNVEGSPIQNNETHGSVQIYFLKKRPGLIQAGLGTGDDYFCYRIDLNENYSVLTLEDEGIPTKEKLIKEREEDFNIFRAKLEELVLKAHLNKLR